jgi:hypothetical protein
VLFYLLGLTPAIIIFNPIGDKLARKVSLMATIERAVNIYDGAVFVGDAEIPLARPLVEFFASDEERRERTLRFHIAGNHAARFLEAVQICVHANPQASGYTQTALVASGAATATAERSTRVDINYVDVEYADVTYFDVTYCELGRDRALIHNVHYADVVYSAVSYIDVTYSSVDGRRVGTDTSDCSMPDLLTLTITGWSDRGRRIVINVDGIIDVQVGAGEESEVVVRLESSIPVQRLLWIIEGM